MKTRKQDDRKAYKTELKYYRKKCRRDKRNSWHRYLDGISTAKEITKLTKILNKQERNEVSVFELDNGEYSEVGEDTLKILLDTHFPASKESEHIKYSAGPNIDRETIENSYEKWINLTRLVEALEGFESKKSPGPDELKPVIFKHLPKRILLYILFIYKSCVYLHYTPCLLYTSPSPRD